jgi:tetratricopeptide (TPR) repeat protein
VPAHRQDLGRAQNNLGSVLKHLGKPIEAERAHRDAVTIFEQLNAKNSRVPAYDQDLAKSLNNLATLLDDQDRIEEAKATHLAAIKIREKLIANHRGEPAYAMDLGNSYKNLGILLYRDKGQLQASIEWFDKSISVLEPVLAKQPRLANARQFLRNAHSGRAKALDMLRRHDEALKSWDRAIELSDRRDLSKYQDDRKRSMLLGLINRNPIWFLFSCWPVF